MLALLLIYFVGKSFYDLAKNHNKSEWGFAILGVISYYAGTVIGGILIVLFYELILVQSIDEVNEYLLSAMSIPVGILACWGFYKILQSSWSKTPKAQPMDDVLDSHLTNNNRPQ